MALGVLTLASVNPLATRVALAAGLRVPDNRYDVTS